GRRQASLVFHYTLGQTPGQCGTLKPRVRRTDCGTDKRSKGMLKAVLSAGVCALMAVAAGCGSSGSSGPGGTTHAVNQTVQSGAIGQKLDLSKLSPSIKDPSSPVTLTYETFQD